jgi:hypothetical protein
MKRKRRLILIIGVALLLCCGGTLVWYAVDTGLRAAGALPTYTPSPTATPRPTATIKPTATLRPPTNTPLPSTATEEPTITPEPTATVESSYTDSILPILGNYRDALNTLGGLFSDAGTDASLIATDAWRIKVAGRLAVIQFSGDEIRTLTPPAMYVAAHTELLDAAKHLDSMAELSAQGIDALDADKMTQAVEEMNQGNAAIQRAVDAMPTAAGTPEATVAVRVAPVIVATRAAPSAEASTCDCAADTLNCDDFVAWDAQACYLRCLQLSGRDVHGLDGDNDGSACEWKY